MTSVNVLIILLIFLIFYRLKRTDIRLCIYSLVSRQLEVIFYNYIILVLIISSIDLYCLFYQTNWNKNRSAVKAWIYYLLWSFPYFPYNVTMQPAEAPQS